MRNNHWQRQINGLALGGAVVLLAALVGCGSSNNGGTGGATGSGGKTAAGGASGSGGVIGSGGKTTTDAGAGGAGGAAGMTGTGDRMDGGATPDASDGGGGSDAPADAPGDTAAEAGPDVKTDTGPCVTSFGAGNPLLYAFNLGANAGWYQFVGHDEGNTGLTTSLGASFTEGHSCPGSLQFASNFIAYQAPAIHNQSGATEVYFGANPAGGSKNWSAYKALHAWAKIQTADVLGLDTVYFYVKSVNGTRYTSASKTGAVLGDWSELVVDLTAMGAGGNGVTAADVTLMGFEVTLHQTPPVGAPATPSPAILFVDDIWLEALPPADSGTTPADAGDAGSTGDASSGG